MFRRVRPTIYAENSHMVYRSIPTVSTTECLKSLERYIPNEILCHVANLMTHTHSEYIINQFDATSFLHIRSMNIKNLITVEIWMSAELLPGEKLQI
jgi:hypothetical protein